MNHTTTLNPTTSIITPQNAIIAIAGSLLLAASAHITVPLYPAPVTLQSLAVILLGMSLGKNLGLASVLLYLTEGALGFPVFSSSFTISSLGYLLGFIPAVLIAGHFKQLSWNQSMLKTALASFLATIAIYTIGIPVLATFIGLKPAISLGVLPFILGDSLKIIFISLVIPRQRHNDSHTLA